MEKQREILCFGEILWDALPSGIYLGGAPLNVCYHLNRFGVPATIASRVGDDRLGKEAVRRISRMGISTELVQVDPKLETGFVEVEFSNTGEPSYHIVEKVAWDHIRSTAAVLEKAENCWGVVFGSLAQRSERNRQTLRELWKREVRFIFDINLRPPHLDREAVRQSLERADILKMNEGECGQLVEWYGLPAGRRETLKALADRFGISVVCLSRGAKGAVLYREGRFHEHGGFPVKSRDVVGAGDAFLASLVEGLMSGLPEEQLLKRANATGALVAQKEGAMPEYSPEEIRD